MEFFAWCMLAAGLGMGLGSVGTGIGQGLAVKRGCQFLPTGRLREKIAGQLLDGVRACLK